MKLPLIRPGNDHGEWVVTDVRRGYRICAYNHSHHGGVHLHGPGNHPTKPLAGVASQRRAWAIMARYHELYEHFSFTLLEEVISECNSESAEA